jgi:hypothetical protein
MQRLNAIDSMTPAWDHTQRLLLTPRNWRLLLKVGAVACFAQMGGCNANFNFPRNLPHHSSPVISAAILGLVVFLGILFLLVGLVLFYIGSRLQFVLFEVVVRQDTHIGPIWSRYGPVVWRWIGLKCLYGLIAFVCMLPIFIPLSVAFVHAIPRDGGTQTINTGPFLATLFGFLGIILLLILVFTIGYALLVDFGLPSMALEDVPIGEAVRRIFVFIRQEPGQIALFLFMRAIVAVAWAIGGYMALGIALLILLIPFGGVAFALWAGLHQSGAGGYAVMILGWIVLGLVVFVAFFVASIMVFGYLYTFLQAWTVYFLGGRYPLLGNFLEPGPSVPFTPPPSPPSAQEREDEDGGPPMPMNPAVA